MLVNKIIIPKCARSFMQWYTSDPLREKIYNDLGCPKPFDVSLRDGLQSLSKDKTTHFTLEKKNVKNTWDWLELYETSCLSFEFTLSHVLPLNFI